MSLMLRTSIFCAVGFATLGAPAAVQRASAEPVTIVSGTAAFGTREFNGGSFDLRGTEGFRLAGGAESVRLDVNTCAPCVVGETAFIGGSLFELGGGVSLRGRAFDFSQFSSTDFAIGEIGVGGL